MVVLVKIDAQHTVYAAVSVVGFGETVTQDELFNYLSGYHTDETAEVLADELFSYSECEVADLSSTRYSLHTI